MLDANATLELRYDGDGRVAKTYTRLVYVPQRIEIEARQPGGGTSVNIPFAALIPAAPAAVEACAPVETRYASNYGGSEDVRSLDGIYEPGWYHFVAAARPSTGGLQVAAKDGPEEPTGSLNGVDPLASTWSLDVQDSGAPTGSSFPISLNVTTDRASWVAWALLSIGQSGALGAQVPRADGMSHASLNLGGGCTASSHDESLPVQTAEQFLAVNAAGTSSALAVDAEFRTDAPNAVGVVIFLGVLLSFDAVPVGTPP